MQEDPTPDTSSPDASPNAKLVKSLLLFRHGSRGPSNGALKPFVAFATKNQPQSEWAPEEIEQLTSVGKQQMENLGAWYLITRIKNFYLEKQNPDLIPSPQASDFIWRSSKVQRVIDSAQNFWQGIQIEFPHPKPLPNDLDPDAVFRPWNADEVYTAQLKALRTGPIFEEKGLQEEAFLDEVLEKFGMLSTPQKASWKIDQMTYFWEIIECERFFPQTRNCLTRTLTKDQIDHIEELAQWSWGKRLFIPGTEEIIGGKLKDLVRDELHDKSTKFAALSCHDYTILSLFAVLGHGDYPGKPLGWGSFVLFELYELNDTETEIRAYLESHPFSEADPTLVHYSPVILDQKLISPLK